MTTPKATKALCPHCKKGTRVEHEYEWGGIVHDDSYCGRCGKNWPAPPKLVKVPDRGPKGAGA